jgi:hypothetical protein
VTARILDFCKGMKERTERCWLLLLSNFS